MRRLILWASLAAAVLTVVACQPVDPLAGQDAGPVVTAPEEPLGAPDDDFPTTLDELLAHGGQRATEWQDEPRLAELAVALGDDGAWQSARMIFLAADADRLLELRVEPDGTSELQPTLDGLGFQPVTATGLEALPPFPDDALEPSELAAAAVPALAACSFAGPVTRVRYRTGAPGAWDGSAWMPVPFWQAEVITASGGAAIDPATGARVGDEDAVGCLQAPPEG